MDWSIRLTKFDHFNIQIDFKWNSAPASLWYHVNTADGLIKPHNSKQKNSAWPWPVWLWIKRTMVGQWHDETWYIYLFPVVHFFLAIQQEDSRSIQQQLNSSRTVFPIKNQESFMIKPFYSRWQIGKQAFNMIVNYLEWVFTICHSNDRIHDIFF